MGTLKTTNIQSISGSGTVTLGTSGETLAIGTGVTTGTGFGKTRQMVTTQTGAMSTGTTIFPEDDTIPQNSEGDQYMTLAITPKSATSRLLITAQVFGSVNPGTRWGVGLFKDSDANAICFAATFVDDASSMSTCYIDHSEISGSTSARTYKIRAGSIQTSATFTFNGQTGSRKFGGVILSSIHITETEV